jgi:hypothetical protein
MRQASLLLSIFFVSTTHAINWSSPTCLFSSDSIDGKNPKVAIHPTEAIANASWVAEDTSAQIYATSFDHGTWELAQVFSDLSLIQDAVNLGLTSLDTYAFLGELMPEVDLEEDVLLPIHVGLQSDLTPFIAWQNEDAKLYLTNFVEGKSTNPTMIFEGIINACFSGTEAILGTSSAVYAEDLLTSTNALLYPRAISELSLAIDSDQTQKAFLFQDQKSNFLLSGIHLDGKYSYSLIGSLGASIANAKVSINGTTGHPTAIWQLNTGQIQTASFNGIRWSAINTLSQNGSFPSIAYDPATNEIIAVWVNLITNTIQMSQCENSSWTVPVSISSEGIFLSNPEIKINSQGNAVVIWSRKETASSKAMIEAITN